MACTKVAQQTYVLPDRPDLGGGLGSVSSAPQAAQPQGNVQAISNDTLKSDDAAGAPVKSGGFTGAQTPLAAGVLEGERHDDAKRSHSVDHHHINDVGQPEHIGSANRRTCRDPHRAGDCTGFCAGACGNRQYKRRNYTHRRNHCDRNGNQRVYMVQVGAVSDQARAQQYQQRTGAAILRSGPCCAKRCGLAGTVRAVQ